MKKSLSLCMHIVLPELNGEVIFTLPLKYCGEWTFIS